MARILYADDEKRYHKLVSLFLSAEGHEVVSFLSGPALIDFLGSDHKVDLVLLDVMMPGMDGWETCHFIRDSFTVPIIMLTSLNDERNEIQGINIGADDYIGKPFSKELLCTRVNALLRRTKRIDSVRQMNEGIIFNDVEMVVQISGKDISLSPKEYNLFKYLVNNKSIAVSRDQILDAVWGYDYEGDSRTVDTHIKSLRARLGDDSERIVTIRTRGYSYKGIED